MHRIQSAPRFMQETPETEEKAARSPKKKDWVLSNPRASHGPRSWKLTITFPKPAHNSTLVSSQLRAKLVSDPAP